MQLDTEGAAASVEYFPSAHCVQVVWCDAPAIAEYVPAGQSSQTNSEAPTGAEENFPGAQSVQLAAAVAARSAEYLPDPHSRHVETTVAAIVEEYEPAKHSVHGTATAAPSEGVWPGKTNLSARECCCGAAEPSRLHEVALFVPRFHVFAEHGAHSLVRGTRCHPDTHWTACAATHGVNPAMGLYVPSAHSRHGQPSAPWKPGSHWHADSAVPADRVCPDPGGHA